MTIITDYGELKTEIATYLNRDDLTNRIPGFIALAENRIAKTVRVREMEATTTEAMVIGQQPYSLPTNYLEFRRVYVDTTVKSRLEFRSPAHYWSIYGNSANGTPKVFTIEDDNLLLGPPPDTIDNIEFLYYAKLAAFSSDSDTNDLLTNATGLYLYGALLESAPFLGNDPRLLIWTQMFEDLAGRVEEADTTDRYSGDPGVGRVAAQNDPRTM